ncbi:hypothetical protein [Planobispora takensis]|nr:hypothetical protein [Planobispora takensis]
MSEHVTVPWSKLLQQPNQVVSLLEEAVSVRLARRDAEDLVITKTSRMDVMFHGIEGVGRFVAALTRTEEGRKMLETSISEAFAWARVMPDDAVAAFGKEFVEMLHGCAELGQFAPLGALIGGWKATAEVYADPEAYAVLGRAHPEGFPEDAAEALPPEAP